MKTSLDRCIHGMVGLRLKEITRNRTFLLSACLPAEHTLVGQGEMTPFGLEVTLFPTPLPAPECSETPSQLQRVPRRAGASVPAGEGRTGALQEPFPPSPRAAPCPGLSPSSGNTVGRSPIPKENNPHRPGPAPSEPPRDGSLAWASPQSAPVRCPPRFPVRSRVSPLPSASAPPGWLQPFGGSVLGCQGRARLGGPSGQ